MNLRRVLVLFSIIALAACSSSGKSSMLPSGPAKVADNTLQPLAIRYGTGTLLLAADKESLPIGAVARVLGFSAYGTTPIFEFFVRVPNPPKAPWSIYGVTSDAQGRIYISFGTAITSGTTYNNGAVAIYDTVPPSGSASNPNQLMTPIGSHISSALVPISGNRLAVDGAGRIYAIDGNEMFVYIYPALSNGPTQPLMTFGGCLDPTSISITDQQQIYEGCVSIAQLFGAFGTAQPASLGYWESRYTKYLAWLLASPAGSGLVFAAEQPTFVDHPEVIPRVEVFTAPPVGSYPDYLPPLPLRQLVGSATGLGYPVSIAACPHGEIYLAQPPNSRFPNQLSGILEFSATSTGNVRPSRVLLDQDKTLSAIGF